VGYFSGVVGRSRPVLMAGTCRHSMCSFAAAVRSQRGLEPTRMAVAVVLAHSILCKMKRPVLIVVVIAVPGELVEVGNMTCRHLDVVVAAPPAMAGRREQRLLVLGEKLDLLLAVEHSDFLSSVVADPEGEVPGCEDSNWALALDCGGENLD
jgi:hypothetical protein